VTIWVVRHGNYVFARSWRGRTSSWFGGVQDGHQGHICAGSVDKDVTFIDFEESDDVNHEIDATYRAKSERYPPNSSIPWSPRTRASTISPCRPRRQQANERG
jgi:hypothetical protein